MGPSARLAPCLRHGAGARARPVRAVSRPCGIPGGAAAGAAHDPAAGPRRTPAEAGPGRPHAGGPGHRSASGAGRTALRAAAAHAGIAAVGDLDPAGAAGVGAPARGRRLGQRRAQLPRGRARRWPDAGRLPVPPAVDLGGRHPPGAGGLGPARHRGAPGADVRGPRRPRDAAGHDPADRGLCQPGHDRAADAGAVLRLPRREFPLAVRVLPGGDADAGGGQRPPVRHRPVRRLPPARWRRDPHGVAGVRGLRARHPAALRRHRPEPAGTGPRRAPGRAGAAGAGRTGRGGGPPGRRGRRVADARGLAARLRRRAVAGQGRVVAAGAVLARDGPGGGRHRPDHGGPRTWRARPAPGFGVGPRRLPGGGRGRRGHDQRRPDQPDQPLPRAARSRAARARTPSAACTARRCAPNC